MADGDITVDPNSGAPASDFMAQLGQAFQNPLVRGLMGMTQGFGQASMPTRVPTPFGAVLGAGMGGLGQGLDAAYKSQLEQAQAQQAQQQAQLLRMQMPLQQQEIQMRQRIMNDPTLFQQLYGGGGTGGGGPQQPSLPAIPAPATGDAGKVALGMRQNNPGNLEFAGQPNAAPGPNNRFASFPDMPTGVAANANQILLNQDQHGYNTVRGQVTHWVSDPKANLTGTDKDGNVIANKPGNPAMPGSYIGDLSTALGVGPDDKVDFHDQGVLTKFILAQQPHESGGGGAVLDPKDVATGVQRAVGPQGVGVTGKPYQVAQAGPGVPAPPMVVPSTAPAPIGGAPAASPAGAPAAAPGPQGGPTAATALAPTGPAAPIPSNQGDAMRLSMQYEQQANDLQRRQNLAAYLKMPAPGGDPTLLRQKSLEYLKLAQAGPAAFAAEQAKLTAQAQQAPQIAGATTAAQEAAKLPYAGPTAAATANAQLPAKLAESGFRFNTAGTGLEPIPGGQADPAYVGSKKAAEMAATITTDRQGNIYQGGHFIGRGPQMVPGWNAAQGGMEHTFTPGVGTGGTEGIVGGGGGSTGILSAPPVQTKETLEAAGKAPGQRQQTDEKFVNEDLAHVIDNVIPAKASLFQLKGLNPDVDAGALGEEKNAFKNFVQTWLPGYASSVGDAAPAQEFKKIVTMLSGQQERGDQGARGGIALLKAYSNANPNLENQPTANKDMVNALMVYHQLREDYAIGATNFYNNSYDRFTDPNGPHTYAPLSRYDQSYIQTMRPELYASAIAAMNGKPSDVWAKGLNEQQTQIVAGIIQRADPSAMINVHGRMLPASSFSKTFGPTDVTSGGSGGG